MTQKTVKTFLDENYPKPTEKNYPTNKTNLYHIDDIWSLDIWELEDRVLKKKSS